MQQRTLLGIKKFGQQRLEWEKFNNWPQEDQSVVDGHEEFQLQLWWWCLWYSVESELENHWSREQNKNKLHINYITNLIKLLITKPILSKTIIPPNQPTDLKSIT